MIGENYFFFDGSAVSAQIRHLWRRSSDLENAKLCPKRLVAYYLSALKELHGNSYKRATFYFPLGDETGVGEHIALPNFRNPGETKDLYIKFCGQKLKKSGAVDKFFETKVPAEFQGRFQKSEKGIDIEICCDAFRLAAAGRLDRLFLFTNDDDFLPLFRLLREYGVNISVIQLTDDKPANISLVTEADSYDVIAPDLIPSVFDVDWTGKRAFSAILAERVKNNKPHAEPSDLDAEALDAEVTVEAELSDTSSKKGGLDSK